jgi:hypothetical protein
MCVVLHAVIAEMIGAQITVMIAEKTCPMAKEEVVAEHSLEEDVAVAVGLAVGLAVAAVVPLLGWMSLARYATKRVSPHRNVGDALMKTMNHMKIRRCMRPPMVLILNGTEIPLLPTISQVSSTSDYARQLQRL